MNSINLGLLKKFSFSFSNKKIFAIFLLFASIIISMMVSDKLNNFKYHDLQNNRNYANIEGMMDCSGSNIIVSLLNDTDTLPHQKLEVIRSFVNTSVDQTSKTYKTLTEILNSQTDSDVIKVDKITKKLDELELCAKTESKSDSKSDSKK